MARPLGVALALLVVLLTASCCAGRDFYVGGRDGWTVNPAGPFNHWAERNRFQVNDTLVFRYNKDADAVLLVSQSHYDTCNTTQPFLRFDGGDSRFGLTNSGPYFFISADAGRCQNGERLIVVVLAVRPPPQLTSPPPVATPTPRALPPPPAPACAGNSSAPSPATVPTPAPGTNRTSEPPSPSSASAKRGDGLAAFLIIGGAAILI